MKYALIGCGRISTNHIIAALNNNLDITAVCDIIPERMEDLLAKHDISTRPIHRYTYYKELLYKENPELVAIATESGNHADIALDCIDSGANLIIEKPIALSLADADEIISRSKSRKVKVSACHQNRFNLAVKHVKNALDSKRFGKLSHGSVHVRWNRNEKYYIQAPWRGTWSQDGGCLMNQSIHGIDLFRWMMGGGIEELCAYTSQRFHSYIECEDVGIAIMKFKNGSIGLIEGTTNVYPKNLEETLYIFGESGTAKLGGKSCNAIEMWQFSDSQPEDINLAAGFVENIKNVYGNGHTSLYEDVIDAINNDRMPLVDAIEGRNALELVLAIYKSSATGEPVKFPLVDGSSESFARDFNL